MKELYTLHGKPKNLSRELCRSYIDASFAVLGFHNQRPDGKVSIVFKSQKWLREYTGDPLAVGCYERSINRICVSDELGKQSVLTTILHECIHSVMQFPDHTSEKCTSTLTSKLKPTVSKVARLLFMSTYKNAAHFAHTKISYRTSKDYYDERQHRKDPVCEGTVDKYFGKKRKPAKSGRRRA